MASYLIRSGSRGEEVRVVQTLVNLHMADQLNLLEVDGIFGPITAQGVKALQGRFGLAKDGLVGPNTMTAMMNDPAESSLCSLTKQMGLAKLPGLASDNTQEDDITLEFENRDEVQMASRIHGARQTGQSYISTLLNVPSAGPKSKRRKWKIAKFDSMILPIGPSKFFTLAGFGAIGGTVRGKYISSHGERYVDSGMAGGIQWDPAGLLPLGKMFGRLGVVVSDKLNPWRALAKYIAKEIGKSIKRSPKKMTKGKIYFTPAANKQRRVGEFRRKAIILQVSSHLSFLSGELNIIFFGGDLMSQALLPVINMAQVRAICILGEISTKPMPEDSINWIQFQCHPRKVY